jgi:tetratricopeptide (TPR) repeat protein
MFDLKKPLASLLVLGLLLGSLLVPARAADETAQVMMLKELFRSEQADWKSILGRHAGLLDQTFFERCEARIRWGVENSHFDDSIRFAIVADMAAMIVRRPDMYRYELAEMFAKAGNLPNALDLCENILLSNQTHWPAWFLRASIYHDMQKADEAYEMYKKVIAGGYRVAECYFRMATIDFALGRDQDGAKNVKECLRLEPEHVNAKKLLAKYDELIQGERIAPPGTTPGSDKDKADAEAIFRQAEKLFMDGDLVTAETLYIQVLKLDRKHKDARKYLGALYYRQANLEKAAEQLAQVATLDPGDKEVWHYLGNTYERMFDIKGDKRMLDQAVNAYQKAAEVDPADPMIQGELLRAQSKLSDTSAKQP